MEHRMCVSCRFFQSGPKVGIGTCGHLDHQPTGIRLLIRAAELRCRRGFGLDDWAPPIIGAPAVQEDRLISERPAPLRPAWFEMTPMEDPAYSAQIARD